MPTSKIDKIKEIADSRGYSLHSSVNNNKNLNFLVYPSNLFQTSLPAEQQDRKQGINLQVLTETDEFMIEYNCGLLALSTGMCGSFDNDKHFNRLEDEVVKRVIALKLANLG